MKKTFVISFPVHGSGYDKIDVDETELVGKTKIEIKEFLLNKAGAPHVCHQCAESVEELECDMDNVGENLVNVEYWEDEE